MSKSKLFQITILMVLLALLPQVASAAGLVPCGGHGEEPCNLCHIFIMIQTLLQGIGLVVAGWAVIYIVIGGIVIMAAGGSPEKASQGKKMITYAIIGIIVAFTAWIAINMIMNELVNPKVMPWPWNKIECKPGEPTPGEPTGEEKKGEYCVCEVPVYDLDPNQWPDKAKKIATDVMVTKLADPEACQTGCVSGNLGTYCPSTKKPEEASFRCIDESSMKKISVCAVHLANFEKSTYCPIDNTCFATDDECINTAMPQTNGKNAGKCWLNGEFLCSYQAYVSGATTHCVKRGEANYCTDEKPFILMRFRLESSKNKFGPGQSEDAYVCSRRYYGNTGYTCRLNCQYYHAENTCAGAPGEEWCGDVKDSFSCFGSFTCKKMVPSQETDASIELKNLLSCMGEKLSNGAKIITSISDNSKGKCFDLSYWDEKGKCSGSTDSCTGTCCGHSRSSLHYGGIAGTVDCRRYSWAIDFSRDTVGYKTEIEGVAKDCLKEMYKEMENLQEFHLLNEGDHLHLQLSGVSKYHRCGTAGL